MNKVILIFLISCLAMSFCQSHAMEAKPSKVLSLKNMILMQIAQESDVEILKRNVAQLPLDLALQVLADALAFNLELYSVAKCELVAAFRAREGLPATLIEKLECIEHKILRGKCINDTE